MNIIPRFKVRTTSQIATTICLVTYFALAKAEVSFRCIANTGQECAFTVFDDKGATNFVLAPNATHGLNDRTNGMKLCVSIGPKGTPSNKYPGCWTGKRVQAGIENTSYPSIAGTWVDKVNAVFTVTQEQLNLQFAGGGRKPGSGSFTSTTAFRMTWPQAGTFTAIVGGDERHITWNNGQLWTRR
jgi:hypothetical protein